MAIHKHLPIYRDAQRLVHQLTVSTRKAPRDLRYTLVQQLVTESVELCCDIADANRASDHVRRRWADASGLPPDPDYLKVTKEAP